MLRPAKALCFRKLATVRREEENGGKGSCSRGTMANKIGFMKRRVLCTRREARFFVYPYPQFGAVERLRACTESAKSGEPSPTWAGRCDPSAWSAACQLTLDDWAWLAAPAQTAFTGGTLGSGPVHRVVLHSGLALHASACHLLGSLGCPRHPTGAGKGCSVLRMLQ